MMTAKSLMVQVKKIRAAIESLGPPIAFRKLNGIVNALEMQIEDGQYQRHAVARLCEALLATRDLYDIPEKAREQIEELACKMVGMVEH